MLVVVVLALLLPSLQRRRVSADLVDRREVNVAIARAQLADLEKRLADGELPDPEFQQERQRLERDLAVDITGTGEQSASGSGGHWMTWPVAALVPVLAGFVYLTIGTPTAIDPLNRKAMPPVAQNQSGEASPDMQEVIARIQQRLRQQPDDAKGWFMLGRAYMTVRQFPNAVDAIRKSYELNDSVPDVIIRLADAIAMSQGGSMAGEPEPLLQRALLMQPDNAQGLWLLGIAQNERASHAEAIATWERLLPLLQDDPQSKAEVTRLINKARQELDPSDAQVAAVKTEQSQGQQMTEFSEAFPQPPAGPLTLRVNVSLLEGVAEELSADTTVFVYAKAAEGPPMPLAVARRTLGDIPFSVTLSDEDAMMPAMKLSGFKRVIVGARLSRSGNAIAKPGDIYGETLDIDTGGEGEVDVKITDVVQ
ncbi:c-type cytochrome biogenesis protein CcmI [Chromatiales bacterium (ex Bugula neritina AB1)]|nr:c-type cytochrome biogenesis protein CcmI [Chromatiales bacterium (ex Bugula neritina AB1)]